MFADYQSQVILAYQTKRDAGKLSPYLMLPTPAKLKDECLAVCQERYLKKDEQFLRSFFEPREDKTAYMQVIRSADIDKFRPLCNFLRNSTTATSDRNVELLAWLIGFEPRPFQIDREYAAANSRTFMEQIITSPKKFNRSWYALLLLIPLIGGSYWLWDNHNIGCMIWTKDHYQSVSCNQKNGELSVIATDTGRLSHFRKINNPDTITSRSLGKIWYIKLNGDIEYYTAGGPHPIHNERQLHPLTLYMLNKYIRHL